MAEISKRHVLRRGGICASLFLSICIFLTSFPCLSSEIPEKSRERLNMILKIIKRYQDANENLEDPGVKDTILNDVSQFVPLKPDTELKTSNKDEAVNEIRKKVALRYPEKHAEFVNKVNREAEEKFKMTKVNEFVSVKYRKGNNVYPQEGIFYGYGLGKKSVKIGNSNISLIDLLDEDRLKFDDAFNKKFKKSYTDLKIENYYKVKNNYFKELYDSYTKSISDQNEQSGYIFVRNKWSTAEDVTRILIDEMNGRRPPPVETETAAEEPPPVEVASTDPEAPPSETVSDRRKTELLKKAEDEWIRIANTYPGIDGDQGYKPALWYMKSDDVNLLLKKELGDNPGGDIKIIRFEEGPIQLIELHFYHGYFFKVITRYRIAKTMDAMRHIADKIRDKYGVSDQEQEAEVTTPEGGGENKEAAPQEPKPEEPPAEEPPPPPPLEESFTWTGKITKGTLYFKRTPDLAGLEEMTFTKENPKVVEEITARLEDDRKKKEAEERKKELELYEKYKTP